MDFFHLINYYNPYIYIHSGKGKFFFFFGFYNPLLFSLYLEYVAKSLFFFFFEREEGKGVHL